MMCRCARTQTERCGDCSPRGPCANYLACRTHRDAAIAADIGVGWARFVWREVDVRQPWPAYRGRCAAIAERLVAWLAETEARRGELARICSWRAAISWSTLLERIRDRPYREPDGEGLLYQLPGQLQFRPRRRRGERRSAGRRRSAAMQSDVGGSSRQPQAIRLAR